jgi:hypothetical protein
MATGSASGYGVSGSGEYTQTDYRESRKNTVLNFTLVLVVIAIIGGVIYYFINKVSPLTAVQDFIAGRKTAAETSIVSGANSGTQDPTTARNVDGGYYPVKAQTQQDYENFLNRLGIAAPIVQAGNIITPPSILESASKAGASAADTVNKLNLNDAYVELPPLQKGLVSVGEGVGMAFGVDLIQMGYDMRKEVEKASGVVK